MAAKQMSPVIDTFIAPPCQGEIEVLFADEAILLINKPSGLLSLSGKNPLNSDSVHRRLVQLYANPLMTHRLDFGTSGIMLLALNKQVNAHITKQFQARSIVKTYESMLYGHVQEEEGCIDIPIFKDPANFPRQTVCYEQGKQALSHYKVLERFDSPPRTRVRFSPKTGRTHQLRVHSQAIGHPILGCDLYGLADKNSSSSPLNTHSMAKRLLLHATTLGFIHPVSGEPISAECACPF
jgi:tRNA pseudouridine32 synthase/23S rRNA pseudouridine746 synthase